MVTDNDQAEYELREARSEISRHHKLIEELREGLDWALEMIFFAGNIDTDGDDFMLAADDETKYDHYRKLLNRQVS